MKTQFQANPQRSTLLLRVGLAAVFLYAGIDALREPLAWIGYVPHVATQFVNAKLALDAISVLQIVLGILLLWGRYVRIAAAASAVLLLGIILPNLNTLLITFRDIGLLFMALALFFAEPPRPAKARR